MLFENIFHKCKEEELDIFICENDHDQYSLDELTVDINCKIKKMLLLL